jgi:hypothetical protein
MWLSFWRFVGLRLSGRIKVGLGGFEGDVLGDLGERC